MNALTTIARRLPSAAFKRFAIAGACAWALAAGAGFAQAQGAYPQKPIRIIVPFGAGSGVDVTARALAAQLSIQMGTSVFVENREGASGGLGTLAVQQAHADGYSLLFAAHPPFVTSPLMQKTPMYDPVKGFTPVAKVGAIHMALIGSTKAPFKSFDQFVDYATKNPGKVSYGHPGQSTLAYLDVERIRLARRLSLLEVPYKATGQVMTDTIAGVVEIGLPSVPGALPFIQGGQINVLAIGSPKRLPQLPDVPTLAEALQQPGFESAVWYGLLAPAGLPTEIRDRLYKEVSSAMGVRKVQEVLEKSIVSPALKDGEAFASEIRRDAEDSRRLIQQLGIQPQ
ncbi:MAG TPA: tripartite tricarboxylate transporter substrate binding protein [Ramlibacter sp.]|nr:tripartite tricarboxylate transporter substrate binding protein [Ramlibacter sp.]